MIASSLYEADKKLTFLLLCICALLLLFVKISFIENETAAFEFLADRPEGSVLQVISALKMLSVPLIYLWKFTVIGFVLWVGCFMFGYRVSYGQCWGVAIISEFVFLIPELIKIAWFTTIETDPTYLDIRGFYPLALISFFDEAELPARYAYPLRALNLFEVAYWALLVNGVHFFARKHKQTAAYIVVCSYVFIFFLWLAFYITVYK